MFGTVTVIANGAKQFIPSVVIKIEEIILQIFFNNNLVFKKSGKFFTDIDRY